MRTLFLSRLLRAVRMRYVTEIMNDREGLGESRKGTRMNFAHLASFQFAEFVALPRSENTRHP